MLVNAFRASILRQTAGFVAALPLCFALRAQATPDQKPLPIDAGLKPAADFFAYAKVGWIDADVPQGTTRGHAREELAAASQRLGKVLDEVRNARPMSAARVAAFRPTWLNETEIEARSLAPLQSLLDGMNAIGDK
ncbi:MAG: hypothetical protein ABJE47_24590 [bacterium]